MLDVHCHIDQFKKPPIVARNAETNGVLTIAVTSLPEHFKLGHPHLINFKYVRLALGFHPMLVGKNMFDENLFRSLAVKTSYIGEVGLEFSEKDKSIRQSQIDVLDKIFKIVNDRPRFISLHSRKAEKCLFDILTDHKIKKAVFHWYSGPLNLIDKIVSAEHFFSINPAMVKSKNGQKIIERIPADRILTESDGPYVTTKGKPVEPKDVRLVIEYLKTIWDKSFDETDKIVQRNFKTIISNLANVKRSAP